MDVAADRVLLDKGGVEATALREGGPEAADGGFFEGFGGVGEMGAFVFEGEEAAVDELPDKVGIEPAGGDGEAEGAGVLGGIAEPSGDGVKGVEVAGAIELFAFAVGKVAVERGDAVAAEEVLVENPVAVVEAEADGAGIGEGGVEEEGFVPAEFGGSGFAAFEEEDLLEGAVFGFVAGFGEFAQKSAGEGVAVGEEGVGGGAFREEAVDDADNPAAFFGRGDEGVDDAAVEFVDEGGGVHAGFETVALKRGRGIGGEGGGADGLAVEKKPKGMALAFQAEGAGGKGRGEQIGEAVAHFRAGVFGVPEEDAGLGLETRGEAGQTEGEGADGGVFGFFGAAARGGGFETPLRGEGFGGVAGFFEGGGDGIDGVGRETGPDGEMGPSVGQGADGDAGGEGGGDGVVDRLGEEHGVGRVGEEAVVDGHSGEARFDGGHGLGLVEPPFAQPVGEGGGGGPEAFAHDEGEGAVEGGGFAAAGIGLAHDPAEKLDGGRLAFYVGNGAEDGGGGAVPALFEGFDGDDEADGAARVADVHAVEFLLVAGDDGDGFGGAVFLFDEELAEAVGGDAGVVVLEAGLGLEEGDGAEEGGAAAAVPFGKGEVFEFGAFGEGGVDGVPPVERGGGKLDEFDGQFDHFFGEEFGGADAPEGVVAESRGGGESDDGAGGEGGEGFPGEVGSGVVDFVGDDDGPVEDAEIGEREGGPGGVVPAGVHAGREAAGQRGEVGFQGFGVGVHVVFPAVLVDEGLHGGDDDARAAGEVDGADLVLFGEVEDAHAAGAEGVFEGLVVGVARIFEGLGGLGADGVGRSEPEDEGGVRLGGVGGDFQGVGADDGLSAAGGDFEGDERDVAEGGVAADRAEAGEGFGVAGGLCKGRFRGEGPAEFQKALEAGEGFLLVVLQLHGADSWKARGLGEEEAAGGTRLEAASPRESSKEATVGRNSIFAASRAAWPRRDHSANTTSF